MPFRSLPTTEEVAKASQYVNRGSVGALCFLLYDILLTFDDEIDLFWRKKWSFMKFNFFFVRYFPLLVQMFLLTGRIRPFNNLDCRIWLIYQGTVLVLTIISCDLILRARSKSFSPRFAQILTYLAVHALYFDSKFIQRLVSFSLILEIIGVCVGLCLGILGIHFSEVCVVTEIPHGLLYYVGAIIIFQTALFGLTLYKFVAELQAGWGNIPIVKLLMRDGTWAFFTLFVMMIGMSAYWFKHPTFTGVLYPWVLTSYSFSGYRILLNINHLSQQPCDADVSGALVSNIEFKSHHMLGGEPPVDMTSIPSIQ
ncbi:hypothetical protein Moror_1355 [Moniliophthora roreri MCA 2997]|uniref:DUF6533 domain-containing protein n=1 Tax=Moniliophthora roreri (strain MCA 2997) TaxID=1381753 RepID=V2WMV6_MONRO|nr:hypothetical protein Moror_1355 [Moniliophthora roreri MCA 2997]